MSFFNVVCCTVMLGPVVSLVGGSRVPEKLELILRFLASKPMELHVHGFGASRLMMLFTMPKAVVLLVCTGVGVCGPSL